jgi:uncharacterized protein
MVVKRGQSVTAPDKEKSMYTFEIYQGRANQYRFRFKASNGEIVAVGEGYTTKQSCQHAIQLLKAEAATASIYDLTTVAAAYR